MTLAGTEANDVSSEDCRFVEVVDVIATILVISTGLCTPMAATRS